VHILLVVPARCQESGSVLARDAAGL
jgi:hypothetical protein